MKKENQIEIWKDIEDFEGLYQVSSFGRVKSIERVVEYSCKNHQNGGKHTVEGRILTQATDGKGYKRISLWKNNKSYNKFVHRLVAQAFIPNPENKETVNHIDFNSSNNNVENLEWLTMKENNDWSYHRKQDKIYQMIKVIFTDGRTEIYPSISKASKFIGCHRDTIYGYWERGYSQKFKELGIIEVLKIEQENMFMEVQIDIEQRVKEWNSKVKKKKESY
jgi:hypothetical protein